MLGVRPDLNEAVAVSGESETATFWKESCQKGRKAGGELEEAASCHVVTRLQVLCDLVLLHFLH